MYLMADGLTRLLAPILSFTADELWRLPAGRARGVGAPGAVPRPTRSRRSSTRRSSSAGTRLRRRCASACSPQIEPLRKNKQIGSSLQAQGRPVGDRRRELAAARAVRARQLPMLFIVSEVELRPAPADARRTRGAAARRHRARRRREVRALLALRADGLDASRRGPGSAIAARTRWPRPSHRMTRSR